MSFVLTKDEVRELTRRRKYKLQRDELTRRGIRFEESWDGSPLVYRHVIEKRPENRLKPPSETNFPVMDEWQ